MRKIGKISVVMAMIMTMALSMVACGQPKKWDELQKQYKTLVELHNEVSDIYTKKNLAEVSPELGQKINESAKIIEQTGETSSDKIDDKQCEDLLNDINKAIDYYKETKKTLENIDTTQMQDQVNQDQVNQEETGVE